MFGGVWLSVMRSECKHAQRARLCAHAYFAHKFSALFFLKSQRSVFTSFFCCLLQPFSLEKQTHESWGHFLAVVSPQPFVAVLCSAGTFNAKLQRASLQPGSLSHCCPASHQGLLIVKENKCSPHRVQVKFKPPRIRFFEVFYFILKSNATLKSILSIFMFFYIYFNVNVKATIGKMLSIHARICQLRTYPVFFSDTLSTHMISKLCC